MGRRLTQLPQSRSRRRGSSLVELALIVPVVAAAFLASFSLILVSARTVQAGAVSRIVGSIAASGQDPFTGQGAEQVTSAARGLGVGNGHAAIFVTEIECNAPGQYKVVRRAASGNSIRWKSAIQDPKGIVELEPGERAWITEVFADSDAIGGIGPAELKVRNVT